jgi:hypothetical protein
MTSARAYVTFLLETVLGKDLFTWVGIEPVSWWHNLLFLDAANYGGVQSAAVENVDAMDVAGPAAAAAARPVESQDATQEPKGASDVSACGCDRVCCEFGGVLTPCTEIDAHWNIALYLPRVIQEAFELHVRTR